MAEAMSEELEKLAGLPSRLKPYAKKARAAYREGHRGVNLKDAVQSFKRAGLSAADEDRLIAHGAGRFASRMFAKAKKPPKATLSQNLQQAIGLRGSPRQEALRRANVEVSFGKAVRGKPQNYWVAKTAGMFSPGRVRLRPGSQVGLAATTLKKKPSIPKKVNPLYSQQEYSDLERLLDPKRRK